MELNCNQKRCLAYHIVPVLTLSYFFTFHTQKFLILPIYRQSHLLTGYFLQSEKQNLTENELQQRSALHQVSCDGYRSTRSSSSSSSQLNQDYNQCVSIIPAKKNSPIPLKTINNKQKSQVKQKKKKKKRQKQLKNRSAR